MVFESLVTELVNKYLGDFIENLDSSQLKIGIWGGECCNPLCCRLDSVSRSPVAENLDVTASPPCVYGR